MHILRILPIASLSVQLFTAFAAGESAHPRISADVVLGAIMGAAMGDALGRITEFIDTTEAIHKNL